MTEQEDAYARMTEGEIEAVRMLLETETRKVLIVAIGSEGDDVSLCRSVSGECTKMNGAAFVLALEREIARIKGLIT